MKKLLIFIAAILFFASCNNNDSKKIKDEMKFEKPSLTKEEKENGILTPEILWKFGRVGEYQISPNKENIVYTITYYDVEANSSNTQLYLIKSDGSAEAKQITESDISCYNPRWINDNTIAYLKPNPENNYKNEIWKLSIDNKEEKLISNHNESINAFEFSPNKENIYLICDVKLDLTPQEIYSDLPNTNVIIAEDLMYRHWNDWSDVFYSHIFVADFKGDKIPQTQSIDIMQNERFDSPTSPYFDAAEISWSADSKYIAYTCKKLSGKEYALSTNTDIYLYNIETKNTENICEELPGYDKYPCFSPDGKKIAWTSMATNGYESDKNRLFVLDLASKEKKEITKSFDFNANTPVWSESDNNIIYFLSETNGTTQIFSINCETEEIQQITTGNYDYTAIQNAGKNSLVASRMSMKEANELYRIENNDKVSQLTFTNKEIYENIASSEVLEKWVTTTDNQQMLTWVVLPPNFDSTKTYPAILFCQGGPQSQVSQFFSYRWNFQLMAANGYVVIAPNRRGVPGFGTKWNEQISGDYGGQNMKDYISAVEAVKKESYVNPDKIGAVGASYGGFSVYWLAGHNENKLFKAFIAHCGMFNLESQYAGTEEMFFVNHDLGGAYWEKENAIAQKSFENSPHHFVQNWNTPILIISGGKDFRIPYTESIQAFNAARLNNVEAKLLIFPEETHFVLKPQNSILWQREFKKWLDSYLK